MIQSKITFTHDLESLNNKYEIASHGAEKKEATNTRQQPQNENSITVVVILVTPSFIAAQFYGFFFSLLNLWLIDQMFGTTFTTTQQQQRRPK